MAAEMIQATGRRKSSVARIRLFNKGDGKLEINDQTIEQYFPRETLRMLLTKPLVLADKLKSLTILGNVSGGGIASQAGAVRHGIARALIILDPALRGTLKKEGMLTRDSRMKERKKYGQKGARKRFQFSKR